MKDSIGTRTYTDGGYGWVVVAMAFVIGAITDGIAYSYGLLLVDLVEAFQAPRGEAAVAGGLILTCVCAASMFAGPLSDIYGYRIVVVAGSIVSTIGFIASSFVTEIFHLFFTYGILGGIGLGLAYAPSLICVIHNFHKKRSFANGVAMCGSGAGTFTMSALGRYLLDMYGWRGTLMVLGGLSLQAAVCGLLMKSPRHNKPSVPTKISTNGDTSSNHDYSGEAVYTVSKSEEELTWQDRGTNLSTNQQKGSTKPKSKLRQLLTETKTLMRDVHLSTFLIAMSCASFGYLAPIHLLPDQAVDIGIPKDKTFWITAVFGIGNLAGRLIFGWLGDRQFMNRFYMVIAATTMAGTATVLSCLNTTFECKLAYAFIYGILIGGYIGLGPVVIADLIGADNMGKGIGLYFGFMTVGLSLSGPIGGWIYDATSNYNYTFIVAGSFFIMSAVIGSLPRLWYILPCINKGNKQCPFY